MLQAVVAVHTQTLTLRVVVHLVVVALVVMERMEPWLRKFLLQLVRKILVLVAVADVTDRPAVKAVAVLLLSVLST